MEKPPTGMCRVRNCAGTTTRLCGAPRTIALPGTHGKRDHRISSVSRP